MLTNKRVNRFFQVDVFTEIPFSGNPTGVCILEKPADGVYLTALASEFGLNQTAFLVKEERGYSIRFFTKYSEVVLCAHASIAAAYILHQIGEALPKEPVVFRTAKHDILVQVEEDAYKVTLPEYQIKQIDITPDFVEITGLTPNELYQCSHDWYLGYYKEYEDLRRALPHFSKMKHSDYGHLVITTQGRKGEGDYVQRSFTPNHGVNEEDVSGSAQCALVPFWKEKLHKNHFESHQMSKRGGILITRSIDGKMVEIIGKASLVMEGKF